MTTLRDAAARRRLELNPITTSVNAAQQPYQTPSSALSANSLSAPFGYNPATYTPASSVRPYNPQQWTTSPSVISDTSTHFSTGRPPERPPDPESMLPSSHIVCAVTGSVPCV